MAEKVCWWGQAVGSGQEAGVSGFVALLFSTNYVLKEG
ncbi:hypothetical protein N44_04556 [Microcystis aeruginosa NIES-44]|uniref:Uncharacterized protein n=1 Tax=Microcystis aeruginosa NIES-44 TaxID=449439 RepID=A0A0A1W132_MICAE|nr:hypothetical protein N44_04556 [Microcystis aeruginosa NIES-44]